MKHSYPNTPRDDAVDTLAGISFPDPFRWLETDTEEVREWQRAQAALASNYTREWPHFEALRGRVEHFSVNNPRQNGVLPRYLGGCWFRCVIADGGSHPQVLVSDRPMGPGRILFDPLKVSAEAPPFVSWIAPSPDGTILAIGVCSDGSENNTILLIDVATGHLRTNPPAETLMDNWTGGVHWLPDSSGFFFSAITGPAVDFNQSVYLHRLNPHPQTSAVDIPWTTIDDYRMVAVSNDGLHAVAYERLQRPIPVAVAEISEGNFRFRPFIQSIEGAVTGQFVNGTYIAITNVGAPRGRIVAIPLDGGNPDDIGSWTELISESDAVLRTLSFVGDFLYVTELVDTYSRVRVFDLTGKYIGIVPLPMNGALAEASFPLQNLGPRGHPARFIFGFSSLISSYGIYSHEPHSPMLETLREPDIIIENAVVEDHWAHSPDGTAIPYHIVRRGDVSAGSPQPSLVYAYGAFNAPLVPEFPGAIAAFIEAGGVYVHAHLRGGGEFGREWWEAGRLKNKQKSFDDLNAIAEDLIGANRTAPELLSVTGGSAGGLAAAVAAVQRPELWTAIVPQVPRLDLIGSCRDGYGRMSTLMDRADFKDPDEVKRLASFSPYHLVRRGVRYPAMFIVAGDTDPRCPAWHARKFAAMMQTHTDMSTPMLVHVWENSGHGWALDREMAIDQDAEWLAFLMRHFEMVPSP